MSSLAHCLWRRGYGAVELGVGTGREGLCFNLGVMVFSAGIGVGVGAKIAAYQGRLVFCFCLTTCSEDGKNTGQRRREDNPWCLGGLHYKMTRQLFQLGVSM